jgi:RNA polymerase sigma-B factor
MENGQSERAWHARRLLVRYHSDGDRRAREDLIVRFLPLARQLARRYYHGREPLDDLVQVASLGLVKAVDRFDVSRTTSFTSYAVPVILGELRRHFRDTGWALHIPRGLQERALEVEKAADRLASVSGRAPTAMQIANLLGLDLEAVLEALTVLRSADVSSLDAPRDGQDGERESQLDRIGLDDYGYELIDYRAAVASTMEILPERERVVLGLRFLQDMTQTQIATRLGVSQMQVSRLIRRALARLQQVADKDRLRGDRARNLAVRHPSAGG